MRGKAIFGAAILAGASYAFADRAPLPSAMLIGWKGAGVALLALWALSERRKLLALVLAFGALGDVLLEAVSLEVGAIAFLAGHVVAVGMYVRARRPDAGWGWVLLIPAIVAIAAQLPADRSAAPGIALYSTGLAAMAATAGMSRFPLAAIGAAGFVISDLLIFARLGPLATSPLASLLIWPLYFGGQSLIAFGVGARVATDASWSTG